MRIIRFVSDDGLVHFGEDMQDGTAMALADPILAAAPASHRASPRLNVIKLLAPIQPPNIICIGRNYSSDAAQAAPADHADHALEVFLKPTTALQHPNDAILVPHFDGVDMQLDCEGELAIVIARSTRNVSESDALQHVLGYTIANDITARAFQTAAGPPLWMRGKGFDTFCPIGPSIITPDELANVDDLAIRTIINDKVVRQGRTSQMIRSVPQIIAALSRYMMLLPGSVILTGAPANKRSSASRPSHGTVVAVEIQSLGMLRNAVFAEGTETAPVSPIE